MMRRGAAVLLLGLLLVLLGAHAIVLAQTEPVPPGPTILGMDQTTAIIVGLVLVLVVILAIVAVSRGGAREEAPRTH